jgi:hypothetical protein
MVEWSKDHVAAIGPLNLKLWLIAGTWLIWRPGGVIRRKGRQLVGKVGEWVVASQHLQGCSPHLCQLRTVRLAPASKYWTYRSHDGDMSPVSWYSWVTIGPKPLSPTPGLSHGRRNEVTQDDGWACLSLVAKTSSGYRGLFWLHGSQWKVIMYGDCRKKAYVRCVWTGVGSVHGMLVRFSLAGCILIRITVTLRYE